MCLGPLQQELDQKLVLSVGRTQVNSKRGRATRRSQAASDGRCASGFKFSYVELGLYGWTGIIRT